MSFCMATFLAWSARKSAATKKVLVSRSWNRWVANSFTYRDPTDPTNHAYEVVALHTLHRCMEVTVRLSVPCQLLMTRRNATFRPQWSDFIRRIIELAKFKLLSLWWTASRTLTGSPNQATNGNGLTATECVCFLWRWNVRWSQRREAHALQCSRNTPQYASSIIIMHPYTFS